MIINTVLYVVKKNYFRVPYQSEECFYSGAIQSPIWANYKSDAMTISGETTGTNIGSYTVTFSLIDKRNSFWVDGTTEDKIVTWSIQRIIIPAVPSQSNNLYYTGYSVSPNWKNYDENTVDISGQISGTNVGSYTVTFTPKENYQWFDRTNVPKNVSWSIERALISSLPSQMNTLVYDESYLEPIWNNYDPAMLDIGGTTSATDAGTYNATFTPTSNYQWFDKTISTKTVTWKIEKADQYITAEPSDITLDDEENTGEIVIESLGNGAITATSSDNNIATVEVVGNSVYVTALNPGEVTITIKVESDTNYNSSETTVSVVSNVTTTITSFNWSSASLPNAPSGTSTSNLIEYGNGKLVVLSNWITSYCANASTSSITNWTERYYTGTSNGIAYGDGKFVSLSTGNTVYYSTNGGNTWGQTTISDDSKTWCDIAYGKLPGEDENHFMIVATDGTTAVSKDGIDWLIYVGVTIPFSGQMNLCYGNGIWVVTDDSSNQTAALNSPDYSNESYWISNGLPMNNSSFNSIAYGSNKFVVLSRDSVNNRVIPFYSENGVNWTEGKIPVSSTMDDTARCIAYGSGGFLTNSSSYHTLYSKDGVEWQRIDSNVSKEFTDIVYADGMYVGVTGDRVYYLKI